jgi:hypothetical protein
MKSIMAIFNRVIPNLALGACFALLTGCATSDLESKAPPATPVAAVPAIPATAATGPAAKTEGDTAVALEKKFQDAARGYKVVQRDGKTLYCKREKLISSTIPTLQCLTESQLRNQVETMDEMRGRMRSNGKCTLGVGCGAGG